MLSPASVRRYLGVIIDTVQMKLLLPDDKLLRLKEELAFFAGRRQATRKQIQRLCGILGHCSTVIRGGRTFSHRIIGLLSCFSAKKRRINLTKNFFLDLEWWRTCAGWFNGEARMVGRRTQDMYMDASGSGFGAVWRNDWLAGLWQKDLDSETDLHSHLCHNPGSDIPDNINVQELYPMVESLWKWGPAWKNCKIICHSDNTQVVTGLNTGKSSNMVAMTLLRRIFWLSVLFNCHIVCVHIPGKHNVIADSLSRLVENNMKIPLGLCCYRCNPVTSEAGS